MENKAWNRMSSKQYRVGVEERSTFPLDLEIGDEAAEAGWKEEGWQEEGDAAFTDTSSIDDPSCSIARMFAEAKANTLIANPL